MQNENLPSKTEEKVIAEKLIEMSDHFHELKRQWEQEQEIAEAQRLGWIPRKQSFDAWEW